MDILGQLRIPVVSSLPAAGSQGRLVSYNNSFYYDDGTQWKNVSTGGGGSATPGGVSGDIQYNNGGSFAGAAGISIGAAGNLELDAGASPTTASAGHIGLFPNFVANRALLKIMGPSGLDMALQPHFGRSKIGYWYAAGNGSVVTTAGLVTPTTVGTVTTRNVATTNFTTRIRRLGYVSAATAGALTELRLAAAQYTAGGGGNIGGFFAQIRFTPSNAAAVAGERFFVGFMNSTAAATNVEPNTLTNAIGIGQLSTDNTQFYWIGSGSAAQTTVACGTGVGSPISQSTQAFELSIFAPPGIANTFYMQLTNLETGTSVTRTVTGTATQVPQSTTLLAPKIWKTNNATALAVGFDLISIYVETDN